MTDKPAFPRLGEGFGNPNYDCEGMTLRQWYAGQALIAVYADGGRYNETGMGKVAEHCFQMADAMIREGEKHEKSDFA